MAETSFPLPSDAIVPGSSATLRLSSDVRADVLHALATETEPFPTGPISLGTVGLEAEGDAAPALGRPGASIELGASAQGRMGLAVLDSAAAVVDAMDLGDDRPLPLEEALAAAAPEGGRFVLFYAGYGVEGSIEGKHPIGAFGSATFGATGRRTRRLGVVHRIEPTLSARTAVRNTIGSVRLPRQVETPDALEPRTMLVTEVNGSLALSLGAQLGWDLSYVRELDGLGLTGDVGLKVDLGVKATLGFEASGRYLLALDRPGSDPTLRLRLFKLSESGWQFGLNLAASVEAEADLPDQLDAFVRTVFGVHGQQVVGELKRLEGWTDPDKDPASLVAGLTVSKGLELLERATGLDPETEFQAARDRVVEAVKLWDDIPDRAVGAARELVGRVAGDADARASVERTLAAFATDDREKRREALLELVRLDGFEESEVGRFLLEVATNGVLSLLDDPAVETISRKVKRLVDGSEVSQTLERLQDYVEEALNLDRIMEVATETDFDALNEWLVQRLAAFLGETISFEKFEEVRATIHKVIKLRQVIYEKARSALNETYDLSLAAAWQRSTARSALLDAEFDMSAAAARDALAAVLRDASYDALLASVIDGVRLHDATLSHRIQRSSSLEVTLPFYLTRETRLNESLAEVAVEQDAGRVLVYTLSSRDEAQRRGQYRSRVAISAAVSLDVPGVRVHGEPRGSWSHSYRFVQRDMKSLELVRVLQPFADEYLRNQFPAGGGTLAEWVLELDREVENVTGNGPNELGDVLLALDVVAGEQVFGAWSQRRTREEATRAAKQVSRALQKAFRRLLLFHNTQDLDRMWRNEPMSALIVWASLPTRNEVRVRGGRLEDVASDDVYWNWPDIELRGHMIRSGVADLARILADVESRLRLAGRSDQAGLFEPHDAQAVVDRSDFRDGMAFHSLLFAESQLVGGAARALDEMARFWEQADHSPSKAIEHLSRFGAKAVSTIHSSLRGTYGTQFLRPLASTLFVAGARGLGMARGGQGPEALLSLSVLREGVDYELTRFLEDEPPEPEQMAVRQRIAAI